MIDIACIGHITKDAIVTTDITYSAPGGTAYYFSVGIDALIRSSHSVMSYTLITKEGTQHFFENSYDADMNNRHQRVLSTADPFTENELLDVEARYIVLGSLLAKDFTVEAIRALSDKGILVLDAQGFLREVRDQIVYAVDWKDKIEALRYVDVLKVNEYEMEVLTGTNDAREAALILAGWGVREVLLTFGSAGSLIYDASTKEFYDIPAFPPSVLVDPTGCGDTYVMGYVFKRAEGASVKDAGMFAAAVSTIKLQTKGPFTGTSADVISMFANLPS